METRALRLAETLGPMFAANQEGHLPLAEILNTLMEAMEHERELAVEQFELNP